MSDRARQFMPFAALKGYYDLIAVRERLSEPRHELTEEEAAELSQQLLNLPRGSLCSITYYSDGAYETVSGVLTGVDFAACRLRIVKQWIFFADIWKIK